MITFELLSPWRGRMGLLIASLYGHGISSNDIFQEGSTIHLFPILGGQ
jgi:hypothetical protein